MEDDVKYLKDLINEYEVVIPSITEQLTFYKAEYAALKKEIITLNKENQVLSTKLEETLAGEAMSTLNIPQRYTDNELIDNLRSQLNLSVKEKESVIDLWREGLKRIEDLECELYTVGCKNNHSQNNNAIQKMKKTYETHVKKLQSDLHKVHVKLEEVISDSKKAVDEKANEINELNKKNEITLEHVKQLENQLSILQERCDANQKEKHKLEETINEKTKIISDLKIDTYNAKLKVAEACHVIEAALIEKDAAIQREKDAQEEIAKLSKSLSEILDETESRIKLEVNKVKDECNDKLYKQKIELKRSQEALEIKNIDYERQIGISKQLEQSLDEIQKTKTQLVNCSNSEKHHLSNKVEEAYQKLLSAERKNIQLKGDYDALKSSIDQINRTKSIIEVENKMLENKTKQQKSELDSSNNKLLKVVEHVQELNDRVKNMEIHFRQEYENKIIENETLYKTKLREIENINAKINNELKTQLESQMGINRKWKNELRQVTERLEAHIQELKQEICNLRTTNDELNEQLRKAEDKCTEYNNHLQKLCQEFNKIASVS